MWRRSSLRTCRALISRDFSRSTGCASSLPSILISRRLLHEESAAHYVQVQRTVNSAAGASTNQRLEDIRNGPTLKEFLAQSQQDNHEHDHKSGHAKPLTAQEKESIPKTAKPLKFFIETYGCQMNISDSEIVSSLLVTAGHSLAEDADSADVVLTNTCAVRDNAEAKIWHRLKYFQSVRRKNRIASNAERKLQQKMFYKQRSEIAEGVDEVPVPTPRPEKPAKAPYFPIVGVLGCMAERLKDRLLLEESVDFICGPDAYRDIPRLLENVLTSSTGQKQANTVLSFDETYADVHPVRPANSFAAFISIMRGCNNMCSFCIVPFTRGRERSRPMASILQEIRVMVEEQGLKEIVLLGQNVNGYHDTSDESAKLFPTSTQYKASPGFNNLFKSKKRDLPGARFADLLSTIAMTFPELRVRFTSPHPKDFPLEVLQAIAENDNICKSVHLPLQSGSTSCLLRMRRGYSQEAYLELVHQMRSVIPKLTISTDIIAGFCGETEEEHQDTLKTMREVGYDQAFMFAYSLREKTHAARVMQDDVPEEIKQRRLREIIDLFQSQVVAQNQATEFGSLQLVLVEGHSTKSTPQRPFFTGRSDGNKRVVFPATRVPELDVGTLLGELSQPESRSVAAETQVSTWSMPQLLFSDIHKWSGESIQSLLSFGLAENPIFSENRAVAAEAVIGEYALVRVLKADSTTLRGVLLAKTTLRDFSRLCKESSLI